jgi:hypothetical protein
VANQIEVKVRLKGQSDERTITYKAYQDTQSLFDLVGQVDGNGNLIEGDPNLNPQHQRKSVNVIAAKVGEPVRPKFDASNIPESLRAVYEEKVKIINPRQDGQPTSSDDFGQAEKAPIQEETKEQPSPVGNTPEPKQKRKYTKRIKENV